MCYRLLHWQGASELQLIKMNGLKPSGHYMYRQFNIQKFYVLPTQCIFVFCVDLRTNSDYTTLTDWALKPKRTVFTARCALDF
jgi:hypothetical protein